MGTWTRFVTCLVLVSYVGTAQAQEEGDSPLQEVNTAGSLFSYFRNPVIAPASSDTTDIEEVLAEDQSRQTPETPAPVLINQTDAGTSIPIGDVTDSPPPPSQRLVQGNRSPLVAGNDTIADQNRDFVVRNENLKEENEARWRQFEDLVSQINAAKQSEETFRTQSMTDIEDLLQQNQALAARNRELQDMLAAIQSNYTQAEGLLNSGELENLQAKIASAAALNETMGSEMKAIEAELAALSNFTGQPLDYRSGSVQQYLLDKNQRMADSGLTNAGYNEEQGDLARTSSVVGIVQVKRDEDSEDDNGDDLEASLDMVYIVTLGFIFLMLQTLRVWLGYRLDSYMAEPLHALFVDVSLMVALAILTAFLNHMGWFDSDKIDLGKIVYGFCLFILFWLLLGLWLVIAAQSMARRWFRWEAECTDLLTLTQQYQQAYLRYIGQVQPDISTSEYRQLRLTVQYAVMRQLFICPVYLPFPTEQLLRTDFNMGEYLARCLAGTLTSTFQLTFIGLLAIIGAVGAWRAIIYGDFLIEMIFFVVFSVVLLVGTILLIVKLRSVFNDLVPDIYEPESFSLPISSGSSLASPGRIAQPHYLQGSLSDLERSQEAEINCICYSFKPLQLSCAYIFSGRLPNRHELLYWFDSYGPQFLIGIIQAICVLLTCWMMLILYYYATNLYREWDSWALVVVVGAVVVWLVTGCYLVPEAIRLLTLTSKIEQMKDRDVIQSVVLQMKADRSLMMVKLYRQVKLIYREMNRQSARSDMYALPDYMQDFVQEVFRLTCNPGEDILPLDRVEDALDLCGVKLTLDELRVFMWESDAVRSKLG